MIKEILHMVPCGLPDNCFSNLLAEVQAISDKIDVLLGVLRSEHGLIK